MTSKLALKIAAVMSSRTLMRVLLGTGAATLSVGILLDDEKLSKKQRQALCLAGTAAIVGGAYIYGVRSEDIHMLNTCDALFKENGFKHGVSGITTSVPSISGLEELSTITLSGKYADTLDKAMREYRINHPQLFKAG